MRAIADHRRVVLVLGAGGAAGWLFHAGVARTLREEAAWDARSADLLIGTSAGAAVAAALRAGADPHRITEAITRGPDEKQRAEYQRQAEAQKRTIRPLAPGLVRHLLPGNQGVGVALAGLLPPGWFPTGPLGRFPGVNGHRGWPAGLWIPAVRVSDGEVVVFGRDVTDAPVSAAVEASSAVPGMFRPREIDGTRFVDGGVASPTHAHLAAEADPDLVIISSPLTRPSYRPMPILARRRLGPERADLAARGISTVVIEPPAQANEAFRGFPRRNPGKAQHILHMARTSTRAALAAADLGSRPAA